MKSMTFLLESENKSLLEETMNLIISDAITLKIGIVGPIDLPNVNKTEKVGWFKSKNSTIYGKVFCLKNPTIEQMGTLTRRTLPVEVWIR